MATRRSTRTLEDQPKETPELLNTICLKLDTINQSLQQIITNQQNERKRKEETYDTIITSISDIQQSVSVAVNKSEQAGIRIDVHRHRKSIAPTWQQHLNKRKQLYWDSLNNENTAVIYETWIHKETKVIPKKFLMKEISNEDAREREIRKLSVINQFKAEINLLKIRADRQNAAYKKVDDDMTSFLENHFSDDTLEELKKLWSEETTNEEIKSQQKWISKQNWMEEYEENFNNDDYIQPQKETKHDEINGRQHFQRNDQQNTAWNQVTRTTRTGARKPLSRPTSNQQNKPYRNDLTQPREQYRQQESNTRSIQNSRKRNFRPQQSSNTATGNSRRNQTKQTPINPTTRPTYAEVARRQGQQPTERLQRVVNNNNDNGTHFLESLHVRKYPPNWRHRQQTYYQQHERFHPNWD